MGLITFAGSVSPISQYHMNKGGDFWRLTDLSAKQLLEKHFKEAKVSVYGNSYAAINFIRGVPAEKLSKKAVFTKDENYQILITCVVKK